MRRIAFVGNCQIEALSSLYARFVVPRTGDRVTYLRSYQGITPETGAVLAEADLLVEQVLDFEPKLDLSLVRAGVQRHLVPFVTASFLWPFCSEPHIYNPQPWFNTTGAYPPELGDAYLNRKIVANVDPETAVAQYLDEDLAKIAHLDRRAELILDKQRSRDAIAGYRTVDIIEKFFRTEQLFITPSHPELRICFELISQFFEAIGATTEEILAVHEQVIVPPYSRDEHPIHPSVCRHFGLTFVGDPETHRYRYQHEGRFTFREFSLRYMRTEWNADLYEAIELERLGQGEAALSKLRPALEKSPRSFDGYMVLGMLLAQKGELDEAAAALERAQDLGPADPAFVARVLSDVCRKQGNSNEALRLAHRTVQQDPGDPHHAIYLGFLLREAGELDAAEQVLHRATQLRPQLAGAFVELGEVHIRKGRFAAAIPALRRAIELDPTLADAYFTLSQRLAESGKLHEAIEVLRQSVTIGGGEARCFAQLGTFLRQTGDTKSAIDAFRSAVTLQPSNVFACITLAELLNEFEQLDEAIAVLRDALTRSSDGALHYNLSKLLGQRGNFAEAAAAAQRSLELDRENLQYWTQFGLMLAESGELAGAEAALRQALALGGDAVVAEKLNIITERKRDADFDKVVKDMLDQTHLLLPDLNAG